MAMLLAMQASKNEQLRRSDAAANGAASGHIVAFAVKGVTCVRRCSSAQLRIAADAGS
jgi:hypothetical protein